MHLFSPGLCINPVYCVHKIRFPAYSYILQSVPQFHKQFCLMLSPAARIITWMYILMYTADSLCQTSLLYPGTALIRTCLPCRRTSPEKCLYILSRYFIPPCPVRGLRTASARLRHRSYSPAASMRVSSRTKLLQCPFYHATRSIQAVFASVWTLLHPFQISARVPRFLISYQYC